MRDSNFPRVRVIVVNFDGGKVTERCIESLLATDTSLAEIEIVLVDNASVDGLNWVIRENYPQVKLIESLSNEGFARGCNLALQDLDGVEYVALINNDAIVDPNWLRELLLPMDDSSVGAVSPKMLLNLWAYSVILQPSSQPVAVSAVFIDDEDCTESVVFDERFKEQNGSEKLHITNGPVSAIWWPSEHDQGQTATLVLQSSITQKLKVLSTDQELEFEVGPEKKLFSVSCANRVRIINNAGGALYTDWAGGDRGFKEPDLGQFEESCEVFSWCGGAVLLRREYLEQVGIFDPHFFLYYEDFDLSWRGRAQGWKYVYQPSAVVLHEHAYSSKAGSDFFNFWVDRNRRLTLVKNAPASVATRAILGAIYNPIKTFFRHSLQQLRGLRPPSARFLYRLIRQAGSFFRALPSALRARWTIARKRSMTSSDIQKWMITK